MKKTNLMAFALTMSIPFLYSVPSYAQGCEGAVHCLHWGTKLTAGQGKYFQIIWQQGGIANVICLPTNFSLPLTTEDVKNYAKMGPQDWQVSVCETKECVAVESVIFDSFNLNLTSGPNKTEYIAEPQYTMAALKDPTFGESCTPVTGNILNLLK